MATQYECEPGGPTRITLAQTLRLSVRSVDVSRLAIDPNTFLAVDPGSKRELLVAGWFVLDQLERLGIAKLDFESVPAELRVKTKVALLAAAQWTREDVDAGLMHNLHTD